MVNSEYIIALFWGR